MRDLTTAQRQLALVARPRLAYKLRSERTQSEGLLNAEARLLREITFFLAGVHVPRIRERSVVLRARRRPRAVAVVARRPRRAGLRATASGISGSVSSPTLEVKALIIRPGQKKTR